MDFSKIYDFEWDKGNKDKNFIKHKVLNSECEEVFRLGNYVINRLFVHNGKEARYQVFGNTKGGRVLAIVFTIRNGKIRVISARSLNKKEKEYYEKRKTNPKV